jgi:hypothetical protein
MNLLEEHCAAILMGKITLALNNGSRGGAVVEALRYKREGSEIDSRWCQWGRLSI